MSPVGRPLQIERPILLERGNDQRCASCAVRSGDLCQALNGVDDFQPGRTSMVRRMPQGRLVLNGHKPSNWFGIIISGVVKLMLNDPNGRQQIVGLQFPGDYVGCCQPRHSAITAEAATRVEICCFPRAAIEGLVASQPSVGQAMLTHTVSELDAARHWMVVLGNRTALERVATFLVEVELRSRPLGHGERQSWFDLPLSRTELAEYLSVSIETVSRQVKHLRSAGVIETRGRRAIRIVDWDALRAMADAQPSP